MLSRLLSSYITVADVSLLRGKVSNLKHMTHVSGGNESVHTRYVATFSIVSQSVILTCNEPILIDTDDEVAIAGCVGRGIFQSVAYYNFRTKVYHASLMSGLLFYLFALVFLGAPIIFLIPFYGPYNFSALLASGVFVLISYLCYQQGRVLFDANNLIIKKFCDFHF